MNRTYWSRSWVLQEVVFATKVTIYWGMHELAWSDCVGALSLIESSIERLPKSWFQDRGKPYSQAEKSTALRFIDISSRVARKVDDRKSRYLLQPLWKLLYMTRSLTCSDPRDRVFAMLGLARGAGTISIVPDYSSSVFHVYRTCLHFHLQQGGSLDILCLPWACGSGMPSWICTNANDAFQITPMQEFKRVHADSLSMDPSSLSNIYSASPGSSAVYRFDRTNEMSLFVHGIDSGTIKVVASVARAGCVPADWLSISKWYDFKSSPPEAFWRTLVADRSLEGSEPPPPFYARACQWAFDHTLPADDLNTLEMLSSTQTPSAVVTFLRRLQAVIWKRRLVETSSNRIGLAPEGTMPGDNVVILLGCSVPLVLRAVGPATQSYELIGECYIHGLMKGEAFGYHTNHAFKDFELV